MTETDRDRDIDRDIDRDNENKRPENKKMRTRDRKTNHGFDDFVCFRTEQGGQGAGGRRRKRACTREKQRKTEKVACSLTRWRVEADMQRGGGELLVALTLALFFSLYSCPRPSISAEGNASFSGRISTAGNASFSGRMHCVSAEGNASFSGNARFHFR